jgi:hypothetical protein
MDTLTLARSGRVEVNIRVNADVHVTATMARRRVSRLVISEVGNLLYGGEPSLVIGERICWRVPCCWLILTPGRSVRSAHWM